MPMFVITWGFSVDYWTVRSNVTKNFFFWRFVDVIRHFFKAKRLMTLLPKNPLNKAGLELKTKMLVVHFSDGLSACLTFTLFLLK